MFISLITLLCGIIIGLLWAVFNGWLFFRIAKINCPQCKQLKPLKEIFVFNWKTRTITGQSCQKCQRPKPQVSIEL